MSKIKEIVQSRLNELEYIKMQKEDDSLIVDQTTTSISLRVSRDLVKQIDIIANELELSRSDIIRSFLSASVSEAFQGLNMSFEEILEKMAYLSQDDPEEVKRRKNLVEKMEEILAEQEEKENE